MIDWGFNVLRLGVLWVGLETEPGVYNMTMLQKFDQIINKLGERGIYTFIDSH